MLFRIWESRLSLTANKNMSEKQFGNLWKVFNICTENLCQRTWSILTYYPPENLQRAYVPIRMELIVWISRLIGQCHVVLVVNILIITVKYASTPLDVSSILGIGVFINKLVRGYVIVGKVEHDFICSLNIVIFLL